MENQDNDAVVAKYQMQLDVLKDQLPDAFRPVSEDVLIRVILEEDKIRTRELVDLYEEAFVNSYKDL